jgi:hypothetical protein
MSRSPEGVRQEIHHSRRLEITGKLGVGDVVSPFQGWGHYWPMVLTQAFSLGFVVAPRWG